MKWWPRRILRPDVAAVIRSIDAGEEWKYEWEWTGTVSTTRVTRNDVAVVVNRGISSFSMTLGGVPVVGHNRRALAKALHRACERDESESIRKTVNSLATNGCGIEPSAPWPRA